MMEVIDQKEQKQYHTPPRLNLKNKYLNETPKNVQQNQSYQDNSNNNQVLTTNDDTLSTQQYDDFIPGQPKNIVQSKFAKNNQKNEKQRKQSKFLRMQIVEHYQKEKAIINKIKNRITRDKMLEETQNNGSNINYNSKISPIILNKDKRSIQYQQTLLIQKQTMQDVEKQNNIFDSLNKSTFLQMPAHTFRENKSHSPFINLNKSNNIDHYQNQQMNDNYQSITSNSYRNYNTQIKSNKSQPFGCPAIYKIGEFKEYRKQVGKELFKSSKKFQQGDDYNEGGFKEFEKMEIFHGLNDDSQENQAKNETLRQIIKDLQKKLKRFEISTQQQTQENQNFKSRSVVNSTTNRYAPQNLFVSSKTASTNRDTQVFLPKIAKQKVIDQFINLSTADVFNNPQISLKYKNFNTNAISPNTSINHKNDIVSSTYRHKSNNDVASNNQNYNSIGHNRSVNVGMIQQLDEQMLISRGTDRAKLGYLQNLTLQNVNNQYNQLQQENTDYNLHQSTYATSNFNNTTLNNNTVRGSVNVRKYNRSPININIHQFQKLKEDYTLRYKENLDDTQKLNKSLELGGALMKNQHQENMLQSVFIKQDGKTLVNSSMQMHQQYNQDLNQSIESQQQFQQVSQLQQYQGNNTQGINEKTNITIHQNLQNGQFNSNQRQQIFSQEYNQTQKYSSLQQSQQNKINADIEPYQQNNNETLQQSFQQQQEHDETQPHPKKSKKKHQTKREKHISQRMKELLEARKKIQEQLRNKYYWNNFTMKQDDNAEDALDENGKLQMTESQIELQRNMKILQKYQRFPLSDIYKEKKQFIRDMRKKYGNTKIDQIVAQQIDEYKFKNQVEMANELLKLHGLSQYDYE